MKKIYTLLTAGLFALSANAQAPAIQWQQSLGGTDFDKPYSIIQTTDGGYALAGSSRSNDGDVTGNHGNGDYWIVKLSNAGVIQWQNSLGGTDIDGANSIIQTTDGGYAVAGSSRSNDGDVTGNHGDYDYWIVKLSSMGAIQWQQSLGGTDIDQANSIIQTTDGGYAVAGDSYSNDGDVTGNHGDYDYWAVKLSSTGAIQWQQSLGGTDIDKPHSIIQTTDGGYAIAGFSRSNDGDVTGSHGNDYWIVKLSDTGAIQWQQSLGGTDIDGANSIIQTTDGGYAVAGDSYSNDGDVTGNHGDYDYWIVKLSSMGAIQWQQSLGGISDDEANSIIQTTDGGYAVAGDSYSNDGDVTGNHGDYDYWIVKLSSTGAIQWQQSLGGTGDDEANSIIQTTDGGYAIAGWSGSNDGDVTGNHGNQDYWIVKLDGATGLEETANNIAFSLYPIPATRQLFIETKDMAVSEINIYNSLGSLVMQIKQPQTGSIDIGRLAKGVYLLQARTDQGQGIQKLVKE